MRVLIVTQYFDPEPVPIPGILAKRLAERGHEVAVITARPSYPDGRAAYGSSGAGSLVTPEGVRVRRIWSFIPGSRSALARVLGYGSFGLSSILARGASRADVVYVYATQMTAAIGPSWWSRMRGTPYVLHVQDLWPESITSSGLVATGGAGGAISAILRPWLRGLYRRAAAVIAIGPGMRGLLVERGADPATTHALLNWATDEAPVAREPAPGAGLRLMYGGNLGEVQDLGVAIQACAALLDLPGFTLTIVGSGAAEARLREAAELHGATNVSFLGRVPAARMRELYAESDFQLISLADAPIFRVTIPSKLQGSLAAGIPVISTVAGDAADIVEGQGIGIHAPPGSPALLAEAIRRAYALSPAERRAMGERAQAYYRTAMSQSIGIDRIEHILEAASHRRRNGTP